LHRVWVTLKHAANLEQLQHLAGLLDDNDHLCHWQAFGLRGVLDGVVVSSQIALVAAKVIDFRCKHKNTNKTQLVAS
jgi:hypothetical protein